MDADFGVLSQVQLTFAANFPRSRTAAVLARLSKLASQHCEVREASDLQTKQTGTEPDTTHMKKEKPDGNKK
eukprot:4254210-Amphidinium_carterae.1